jgi:hypothetical protein
MDSDRGQIENLMARYCELFDNGDLDGYSQLFAHGRLVNAFTVATGAAEVKAFHERAVKYYDGLPHTRHVTTNVHIEIDGAGETASARSYVTVFQALPDFPLQPVFVGQYLDQFEKVDGVWRWGERRSVPFLFGDLSRHGQPPYPPAGPPVPGAEPGGAADVAS